MVQYTLMRGFVVVVLLLALAASVAALLRDREGRTLWRNAERLRPLLALDGVPVPIVLGGAALWALIVIELVLGLMALIGTVIFETPPGMTGAEGASGAWRFRLAQVAALTAVLGAVVALPVTLRRLRLTREQTATAEEALFNTKITDAASGLYAQRQVTRRAKNKHLAFDVWEDDVIRRVAAIDRLEELARERAGKDAITVPRVARLMASYVNELSRQYLPVSRPKTDDAYKLKDWVRSLPQLRRDMESAAQTLGRLAAIEGFNSATIDLSKAALQKADLWQVPLQEALLWCARLEGANLSGSRLERAALWGARLEGAHFVDARLDEANLWGARLEGADLRGARLEGANLCYARLDALTDLTAATLHGAAVKSVDFTSATQIEAHLFAVFGDGSTTLPSHLDPATQWPSHWPKHELEIEDFFQEWERFRADPKGYEPPEPRDADGPADADR